MRLIKKAVKSLGFEREGAGVKDPKCIILHSSDSAFANCGRVALPMEPPKAPLENQMGTPTGSRFGVAATLGVKAIGGCQVPHLEETR